MDLLLGFVIAFSIFILVYFLVLNSVYVFLIVMAGFEMLYHVRKPDYGLCEDIECHLAPTISLTVPAHNEEATITESVYSFRQIEYPNLEIIIVNDGSIDNTLKVLKRELKLISVHRGSEEAIKTQPVRGLFKSLEDDRILVIDKENGGKSDALNVGLKYSRSQLFAAVDADSMVEKHGFYRLVKPYLDKDSRVIAIGGIVRVLNNSLIENYEVKKAKIPRKFLPSIQAMEYIRAFLFGRAGLSRIHSLPIISGAFGLFDREAAVEVGGYRNDTVGEDMDLVIRLHELMRNKGEKYDISFLPDPVCWTQVPESLKVLGRQRRRWQRGLIESLAYNWNMIFNPRYGSIGVVGLPFFFIFEMLSSIVEVTGYFVFIISFIMGWIDIWFFILFLILAVLFGVLLSLMSLLLEEFSLKRYQDLEDRLKLAVLAFMENFGYRQVHSFWRFWGTIEFFRKKKGWGEMTRTKLRE